MEDVMVKKSSMARKLMVLMMAFAVVVSYSFLPMNQTFAASKKPAKVSGVKAKALKDVDTSIQITWKKAKSAKKYQVYRATSKKGKYKKVATVTSKKYVNKNLKNGKKYYYKVRAINGKKKGKFSKIVSAKAVFVPQVKEQPATIGESKSATLTTEIDMSQYDAGKVVKVWVPVPQTDTKDGYQYITNESFTADKATKAEFTTEKVNGNKMLYLEWGADVAPADRKATLTFTAKRYDVSRTNLKDNSKATLSAEAKAYVSKQSQYVNISDPVVKKYAAEAVKNVKNKNSTLEKTRAIYEWVIKNLARIDNGEKLGDYTFGVEGCGYGDTKKILGEFDKYGISGGHCTDLNSTFVALCRANGIAAREMFGIRLGKPGENITSYQHCWAEFYLPGTGWVFADPADVLKAIKPTKAEDGQIDKAAWAAAKESDLCKEKTEYFWGHVDNNRVVLSRGRDVTFNPAQSWGACNTFGYPAAEVDGKRTPEDFTNGPAFTYKITSDTDKTVFVDAAYVKAASESKNPNLVIAEVSWGPDAPAKVIPGAIHVNTDDLESNYQDKGYELWDLRGFDNNYNELRDALAKNYGITKDTELIVYGDGETNSAPTRLAFVGLMLGVKDVKVLDGGAGKWDAAGYGEAAPAKPKSAESFGTETLAHPDWIVDTAELVKGVEDDTLVPVSIRSYDEFIGEASGYAYIDKAGEPKGAVWGRDTDDGTYFKDGKTIGVDTLLGYLDEYGVTKNDTLAFYCGTGWRATIPFLICYQAGMDNMKLWDDGWYVYSGAYLDPWNYGSDETPKTYTDDANPVQLGDPKLGNVTYTTVGELKADHNPLRKLEAKEETKAVVAGETFDSGFSVMPPKGNINDSIKFTSDNTAVAVIDEAGNLTIPETAAVGSKAKITAATNATFGNTREKAGEPKKASYTVEVVESYLKLSAASWESLGIGYDDIDSNDYVVDVRKSELYSAGHLSGSVNCTVSNPYTDDEKTAIKAEYDKAVDAGKRLVIVCVSGNMLAKNAMTALKAEGADMSKVTYLIGGANGAKDHWVTNDYVNMSAEEWAKFGIDAGEIVNSDFLIDVRPEAQKTANGYVPGAVECPVSNPYTAEQQAAIKEAVQKQAGGGRVVIICVTGNMLARNAMAALEAAGADMSNVTYLKGGFNNAWSVYYPVISPSKDTLSVPAWVTEGEGTNGALAMVKKDNGEFAEDLTHHVLVNENGSNAKVALLNTKALPLHVYNGLAAIGGTPADNFNKADCVGPDGNKNVFLESGSAIDVSFGYKDGESDVTKGMSDFFRHVVTPTSDVKAGSAIETEPYEAKMRFGGCMENITNNFDSKSGNQTGCITCTFSCWIGTVSNSAYAYSTQESMVDRTQVPAANTPVTVVYSIAK
jgi:thiosulfate/3-mercaptopyruvate sulfurtransferase